MKITMLQWCEKHVAACFFSAFLEDYDNDNQIAWHDGFREFFISIYNN